MRPSLALALALAAATASPALAAPAKAAAPKPADPAAWSALPDWSGTWQMMGGTVFDTETVSQKGVQAGTAGLREKPPYNAQWEERYLKNIQGVADGSFPDPLTFCGIPAGMPRMINVPDGYEWVVTPKTVWETTENATGLRRIYTDGRPHPKNPGHTYYGHSIGHWEGDTLVVDTVGMRGDTILDRTGVQLSDQRHTVERIRKVDDNTLEIRMTIDDPVALAKPWTVVKRFRKLPKGTYIFDYACAENNRNPVDANGRTITLDQNGKPLHD